MANKEKLTWLTLAILSLVLSVGAELGLECPFPEGQEVSSESECSKYSACEWTDNGCAMQDNGQIGYVVSSDPVDTGSGFTVGLLLATNEKTMFDADVPLLQCEVIYHQDYHVQVKITDVSNLRYEVPLPLNLPDKVGSAPEYSVSVSGTGEPFQLTVLRTATGHPIFETFGALTYEDQFIQLTTYLSSTYLYGFGENTHERLRHQFEPRNTWPIFARDQPVGTGFMNEYGAHPYYSVVEDDQGNTHSVLFLNSNAMEYSTFLLEDGSPALTLRTIGGIVDLHFFLGPTPEDVNMQYTEMIGRPVFSPYWTLGFHLSRWGYNSTAHVRAVRDRMKAAGIPQDAQTFDIDYMDRYRDFTYSSDSNWNDLPQLIDELHADHLKAILILDPAIVIDWDNYEPAARGREADAFIKWMSADLVPSDQPEGAGDYMVGYVWPDTKTVFPDYFKPETQEWWKQELATMHQSLEYDGIWIDMNEPANFGTDTDQPWNWPEGMEPWSLQCPYNALDSPPYPTMMTRVGGTESHRLSDHTICMSAEQTDGANTYQMYDTHSLYGYSESAATYKALQTIFPGKRQFVMSRSTFPGSGQYSIHWLGDNSADWTQMSMSVVGMIEFNLFGIPHVGADICGFFNEPDEEMCARWMQLGAFYPYSRNHNAENFADQDPPAMGAVVTQISREVLLLRYTYLPYLYALMHRAHMNGHTVIRALYNVFPSDMLARDVSDQFLWGDGIMVAPVLTQGATSREVYFPGSVWYDLVSGELVSLGAETLTVEAPLEKIPVYVRSGSILPTQLPALNTYESRLNPFGLTMALDVDGTASGELFYDDGDEEHVMAETYLALFSFQGGILTTEIKYEGDVTNGEKFSSVTVFGQQTTPSDVTVNGVALTPVDHWIYDDVTHVLVINYEVLLVDGLNIVIE